jgi:hypothetical protein
MAKGNNNKTEVKEVAEVKEFVNPFNAGVSYKDFIEAMGDKTVVEYCGEHLGIEQIAWLEIELEHIKNK